jgi:hypothetical protein
LPLPDCSIYIYFSCFVPPFKYFSLLLFSLLFSGHDPAAPPLEERLMADVSLQTYTGLKVRAWPLRARWLSR